MATQPRLLPAGAVAIAEAKALILAGRPVAVPTETVYGLAADAGDGEAIARVYEAKGRPSFNPLIVHVHDAGEAGELAEWNATADRLARAHWPGPLTLVVSRRADARLSSLAAAGLPTIALRSPAHPWFRELLEAVDRPLAAPSANPSGTISPTRAAHVLAGLGKKIELIVDGGVCRHGLESTIVAVDGANVRLLRPGPIDLGLPLALAGDVQAPGQLASHYAPDKPLRLDAESARQDEWHIGFGSICGDTNLSPSGDLVEAAANLFDLLHGADASDRLGIAVAPVPARGLGMAINDRLRRAAVPLG